MTLFTPPKDLLENLVAEVRAHNIQNWYQPGKTGDAVVKHSCDLCKSEWKPSEPETHNGACLIAMADVAIEQMT